MLPRYLKHVTLVLAVAICAAGWLAGNASPAFRADRRAQASLIGAADAVAAAARRMADRELPKLAVNLETWLQRGQREPGIFAAMFYRDRLTFRLGSWPQHFAFQPASRVALRDVPMPRPRPRVMPPVRRFMAETETTARVEAWLEAKLDRDLYRHFDIFLYVSKAVAGPWAQHMFVFAKDGETLKPLHVWKVSTGREGNELAPSGQVLPTGTPEGYYQIDPSRMFVSWRSAQWDARMPYAMFFNWVDRGVPTGLAIHGAGTEEEAALVGQRASAGCVRMAPDAARELFRLVRAEGEGAVPRFAYDTETATLSNSGALARTRAGALRFATGYRVLVLIENFGGDAEVSALF